MFIVLIYEAKGQVAALFDGIDPSALSSIDQTDDLMRYILVFPPAYN